MEFTKRALFKGLNGKENTTTITFFTFNFSSEGKNRKKGSSGESS
jgi:hypothetical protein